MPRPHPDTLCLLLRYDAETGMLFWRYRDISWFSVSSARDRQHEANRWNSRHAGEKAGGDNGCGYETVCILGKRYKSHRVIWAMETGDWPVSEVDHIDGNGLNNRWINLRSVSHETNGKNQKMKSNNASGVVGVRRIGHRWIAYITLKGKQHHLGSFPSKSEAKTARKAAERQMGFHKNHGRKNVSV